MGSGLNNKTLNLSLETLVSKNNNYRHKQRNQDHRSYDSTYSRHAGFSPLLSFHLQLVVASNKLLATIPGSSSIPNRFDAVTTL
jgi:hypothetical protein